MAGSAEGHREIAVPVSTFATLRAELAKECGTLATIHALHAAGYQAGVEAAAVFSEPLDGGVASLGRTAFWGRVRRFFLRRGWGTLSHDDGHGAVGLLTTTDWVEATPDAPDEEGSCTFTTGFLAGFLTTVAGGPVAVLEVACRTRGDDVCTFAFGSESAVHELYGEMLDGAELEQALAAL